jgi:hypothetical protein
MVRPASAPKLIAAPAWFKAFAAFEPSAFFPCIQRCLHK